MMHDHRTLDIVTGIGAAVAAVSFWQGVALALTIIAAIVSIACGAVRLYDRFSTGGWE
jgi:divalent metal cation (Fe/Co/Zn/Cd) transporter